MYFNCQRAPSTYQSHSWILSLLFLEQIWLHSTTCYTIFDDVDQIYNFGQDSGHNIWNGFDSFFEESMTEENHEFAGYDNYCNSQECTFNSGDSEADKKCPPFRNLVRHENPLDEDPFSCPSQNIYLKPKNCLSDNDCPDDSYCCLHLCEGITRCYNPTCDRFLEENVITGAKRVKQLDGFYDSDNLNNITQPVQVTVFPPQTIVFREYHFQGAEDAFNFSYKPIVRPDINFVTTDEDRNPTPRYANSNIGVASSEKEYARQYRTSTAEDIVRYLTTDSPKFGRIAVAQSGNGNFMQNMINMSLPMKIAHIKAEMSYPNVSGFLADVQKIKGSDQLNNKKESPTDVSPRGDKISPEEPKSEKQYRSANPRTEQITTKKTTTTKQTTTEQPTTEQTTTEQTTTEQTTTEQTTAKQTATKQTTAKQTTTEDTTTQETTTQETTTQETTTEQTTTEDTTTEEATTEETTTEETTAEPTTTTKKYKKHKNKKPSKKREHPPATAPIKKEHKSKKKLVPVNNQKGSNSAKNNNNYVAPKKGGRTPENSVPKKKGEIRENPFHKPWIPEKKDPRSGRKSVPGKKGNPPASKKEADPPNKDANETEEDNSISITPCPYVLAMLTLKSRKAQNKGRFSMGLSTADDQNITQESKSKKTEGGRVYYVPKSKRRHHVIKEKGRPRRLYKKVVNPLKLKNLEGMAQRRSYQAPAPTRDDEAEFSKQINDWEKDPEQAHPLFDGFGTRAVSSNRGMMSHDYDDTEDEGEESDGDENYDAVTEDGVGNTATDKVLETIKSKPQNSSEEHTGSESVEDLEEIDTTLNPFQQYKIPRTNNSALLTHNNYNSAKNSQINKNPRQNQAPLRRNNSWQRQNNEMGAAPSKNKQNGFNKPNLNTIAQTNKRYPQNVDRSLPIGIGQSQSPKNLNNIIRGASSSNQGQFPLYSGAAPRPPVSNYGVSKTRSLPNQNQGNKIVIAGNPSPNNGKPPIPIQQKQGSAQVQSRSVNPSNLNLKLGKMQKPNTGPGRTYFNTNSAANVRSVMPNGNGNPRGQANGRPPSQQSYPQKMNPPSYNRNTNQGPPPQHPNYYSQYHYSQQQQQQQKPAKRVIAKENPKPKSNSNVHPKVEVELPRHITEKSGQKIKLDETAKSKADASIKTSPPKISTEKKVQNAMSSLFDSIDDELASETKDLRLPQWLL